MNSKVRRFFAVGLVSASLALSALVGAGAVGASDNDGGDLATRNVIATPPAVVSPETSGTFGTFGLTPGALSDGRIDYR